MSLTKDVAAAVIQRGGGTLDHFAPMFPNQTRRQVGTALKNAKQRGWICVTQRGKGKGGPDGGTEPSMYEPLITLADLFGSTEPESIEEPAKPAPKPVIPRQQPDRARARVSSVWDLGSGLPVFALPGKPGRRFELLGEW
jgi:hypothetical protein